jgi:hypothetical protein
VYDKFSAQSFSAFDAEPFSDSGRTIPPMSAFLVTDQFAVARLGKPQASVWQNRGLSS